MKCTQGGPPLPASTLSPRVLSELLPGAVLWRLSSHYLLSRRLEEANTLLPISQPNELPKALGSQAQPLPPAAPDPAGIGRE